MSPTFLRTASQKRPPFALWIDLFLLALTLLGVYFRFQWVNWHQGANLHPDEYGLTNTLTQLRIPSDPEGYFNTRLSPLSPYRKYDAQGNVIAEGPDNGMRWGQWPMILLRLAAEISGNTGYDEQRLLGRSLSALADTLALGLLFLIGRQLYNRTVGLLAAALSALAVMQIQQSHFMTVDNFAVLFATLAMYAGVRIAQQPCLLRPACADPARPSPYRPNPQMWKWCLVFGVALGMALACKINLLPLGGMLLVALFLSVADLRLKQRGEVGQILGAAALLLAVSAATTLLTFRVTQPMSFRQPVGETTLLTFYPNPDWVRSMALAQAESSGIGGGPPGEQWAHRPVILFPWINMVLWGMGLPLGLMSWAGFLWVAWRMLRHHDGWRAHLLPFVWVGGYFGFMATRWVKSMRYFLPIYPFLCLFAAWGLWQLWRPPSPGKALGRGRRVVRGLLTLGVVAGTLAWALSFTGAVYGQEHTRIQASRWIYEQIPAPFHLSLEAPDGSTYHEPLPAPDGLQISSGTPFVQQFLSSGEGRLVDVILPHAVASGGPAGGFLRVIIASDAAGTQVVDQALLAVETAEAGQPGASARGEFQRGRLEKNRPYYLIASPGGAETITLYRSMVSNETWDEGLPTSLGKYDPFGQLYRGPEMEVRRYDDEDKRSMFLERLARVDYILLPSQRAIWTTCRLPRTYPMTMAYYRALFDGSLGFDLAAEFQAPLQLGPLQISDVGGTVAWGKLPTLPLFNDSLLAAEEAFSVYDHPPVWIFRKRADFSLANAERILRAVDLSQVVIQSARNASGPPCP